MQLTSVVLAPEGGHTFVVVAEQAEREQPFIYATFQTLGGASLCASGLEVAIAPDGHRRPVTSSRIVLLLTSVFRTADYMMTPAERTAALEGPAVQLDAGRGGEPLYVGALRP